MQGLLYKCCIFPFYEISNLLYAINGSLPPFFFMLRKNHIIKFAKIIFLSHILFTCIVKFLNPFKTLKTFG